MKHIKLTLLSPIIFSVFFSLDAVHTTKPWTFLVYIAGDNNLYPYVKLDLDEMKKIGSNEHINILAYANSGYSTAKKTEKFVVNYNELIQDGQTEVKDSGDEQTLIEALEWAINEYPSEHLAVVLWDHGSGPLNRNKLPLRGVCYDDTTGNYLTDKKIQTALDTVIQKNRNGKKIDLVAFDACLMANIEIAYALEPYADYMVSSQETIPGYGYEYARLLYPFLEGSITPWHLAYHMVTAYDDAYKGTRGYTLSAVELSRLENLVEDHSALCNFLLQKSNDDTSVASACKKAASDTLHFDEKSYIDLYDFYINLHANRESFNFSEDELIHFENMLIDCLNTYDGTIIKNVCSSDRAQAHGLSIYFPTSTTIEPSYEKIYWSENTNWLPLLEKITNKTNSILDPLFSLLNI